MSLTDTMGSLVVATKGYCSNTKFLSCCSALMPLTGMTGVSTDIGASFVRPAGRAGRYSICYVSFDWYGYVSYNLPLYMIVIFIPLQVNLWHTHGRNSRMRQGILLHMDVSKIYL